MTRIHLRQIGLGAFGALFLVACDGLGGSAPEQDTEVAPAEIPSTEDAPQPDLSDLRVSAPAPAFETVDLPSWTEWRGTSEADLTGSSPVFADTNEEGTENWWTDVRGAPAGSYRVSATFGLTGAPSSVLVRLENRSSDPMERFDVLLDTLTGNVRSDGNVQVTTGDTGSFTLIAQTSDFSAGDLRVRIFPAASISPSTAYNRAATGSVEVLNLTLERQQEG